MKVTLERFCNLPKGVLGILTAGEFKCFTVERPWLENQRNISCIPNGFYQVRPFNGKRFKNVAEITNVPDRSYILFHAANRPLELEGCIAPGVSFGFEDTTPRVNNSRFALESLFEVAGREFELEIFSTSADL